VSTMQAPATEANPYRVFRATKNFGALNGVRALCCLLVVKEHAGWKVGWPQCLDYGYLGVDMFFTISGFLIVTLMIRERETRGTINLPAFYARRSLRIFPVYYGVVIVFMFFCFIISPWKPNGWEYYRWTFPVLFTYTQDILRTNIGDFFHTWSLAMEEQFYIFWPAAERYLSRSGRWLALVGVIGISQAFNFGLFDPLLTKIYGVGSPKLPLYSVTFFPIGLGVVLAHLLHHPRLFAVLYRILGGPWAFLPLLVTGMLLLEVSPSDLMGWPRLGIQVIFALLLASLVIRPDHHAMRGLAFPPLARIGIVSYGIYVYHVFIIDALVHLHIKLHPALLFLVAALLTTMVAELSFRYFEQPLLRLRARFRDRPGRLAEVGQRSSLSRTSPRSGPSPT
jgi:peptidoglycan/LPS O-acetylase OafA/YrhL